MRTTLFLKLFEEIKILVCLSILGYTLRYLEKSMDFNQIGLESEKMSLVPRPSPIKKYERIVRPTVIILTISEVIIIFAYLRNDCFR